MNSSGRKIERRTAQQEGEESRNGGGLGASAGSDCGGLVPALFSFYPDAGGGSIKGGTKRKTKRADRQGR